MRGNRFGQYSFNDPFNYQAEERKRIKEEEESKANARVVDSKEALLNAGLKLVDQDENKEASISSMPFPWELPVPIENESEHILGDKLEEYAFCMKDTNHYADTFADSSYENDNVDYQRQLDDNKSFLDPAFSITDILQAENFIDKTEKTVPDDIQPKAETIAVDYYTAESESENETHQVEFEKNTAGIVNTVDMLEASESEEIETSVETTLETTQCIENESDSNIGLPEEQVTEAIDLHYQKTEFKDNAKRRKIKNNMVDINPDATDSYNALDILLKLKIISENRKDN